MTAHPSDEELIAHLYGIGPEDGHVASCPACQARLSRMQAQREAIDLASPPNELAFDFLAAQRRRIYGLIAQPVHWWSQIDIRRWGSAVAALAILASGLLIFENSHKPAVPDSISDAQLAQEVSRIAEDPEPPATAPLQALFEE
jgi:hypothetical protein